jgi:diacylglycerol O-acyltransferase / wax synthase
MRTAGGLDSTFLALETHGHPLHVMAVMMLDPATVPGGYSFAGMREFVADRLGGIPPFRRKLVPVPMGVGRPRWVDVEVNVDNHVHRVVFDGGGLPELARFVADLEPEPLDRDIPLWSMHVVEGLDDDIVAVVAKVHHALMDGVGGMQFMASMYSLTPTPEPIVLVGDDEESTPPPWERILLALPEVASAPVRVTRALVSSALAVLRVRDAFHADQTLERRNSAPHMRWNDPLGATRSIAFASLPLDAVKDVGRATGATVNDVVLAVLGGASRSYLQTRGELPDRALVAAVPVSVRRSNQHVNEVANAVTLMFSSIGTDIADPHERVKAVHASADGAKHLQDAIGPDAFLQWLDTPSPLVIAAAARLYVGLHLASRAPTITNLLVSNVPGPPVTLYFGGAGLLALYPLGPVYDGVGLNITVVSNVDTIGFGFVTCPDVVSDIDALAAGVPDEFALLCDAVGLVRDTA